uniref:Putative reverse transcriptase n=1 Tax=Xenopsylla cheopis TaxID=163159 RepID=A0A6M2DU98_XENCH
MPVEVLTVLFNIFLMLGKVPADLIRSYTILIPKKAGAALPGDFRPITVSSLITRTFHKVLAKRLMIGVKIDGRQKGFQPVDGCAENTLLLDQILRHQRQNFKQAFIASIDVAKAFDSVSHTSILDTLEYYNIPKLLIDYVKYNYKMGQTTLKFEGSASDPISPRSGVKQGDPLSPILFNLIVNRLIERIPPEIGVNIEGHRTNVLAFADDLILVAETPTGLQTLLDISAEYLSACGLDINLAKSFTVSIRNVPHVKKSVIDQQRKFRWGDGCLPALKRSDEWKYLGVQFTPEGLHIGNTVDKLTKLLNTVTRAPLKPQQRLFVLRTALLPRLMHEISLGSTKLSQLNTCDKLIRERVRGWLTLPKDTPNAYFHANMKDGGLSISSLRWVAPLRRKNRLSNLPMELRDSPFCQGEIAKTMKRLKENGVEYLSGKAIDERWAKLLYKAVDGAALVKSRMVHQQHRWITDGTRLLSGRDYINAVKLRINALPTKSRTSRGRIEDRQCRAGCRAVESLDHILQSCHRTHKSRIDRHNAVSNYIKRALEKKSSLVEVEPKFQTQGGLRKPDLLAVLGNRTLILDAQVVGSGVDLEEAHRKKIDYYKPLASLIMAKYGSSIVTFGSITLNNRGIWSKTSAEMLLREGILKSTELKIVSTRTLVGGLNGFWRWNKTCTRKGIG